MGHGFATSSGKMTCLLRRRVIENFPVLTRPSCAGTVNGAHYHLTVFMCVMERERASIYHLLDSWSVRLRAMVCKVGWKYERAS